jgi:xylulokinase
VESVLASLAEAAALLAGQGVPQQRVLLIGGGSRSAAIRELAPGVFGVPVLVPDPGEYVALGAARQAAWALAGTARPPEWQPARPPAVFEGAARPEVRRRHVALRDDTAAWQPAR